MSKIVYLYVKPLFLYYFLLIATMTKAMFVNSQQLLFIILFICEVITLHKINMISLFLFILFLFILFPQDHSKKAKYSTQNYSSLYITHGLDYIDRDQHKNSKLDHTKLYSTRSRYNQKDQTKKNGKDKSVMVIRYWGTPPSLAVAKGSAHTHVIMSLFSWVVM